VTDVEVVVVGAGPAGSTLAGLLAAEGHRVLVVDRARFPRPKACGECLSPGSIEALSRMGLLAWIEEASHATLDGWRLRSPGVDVAARFGADRHGYGMSRQVLDASLLDAARARGAEVLEEAHVRHAEAACGLEPPSVTIRTREGASRTLRARIVVGADGLRSVVSRSLGLVRRAPRLRKVSLTFHLRVRDRPGPPGSRRQGVLDTGDGVTLGLAPIRADASRWNATLVADARRHGRLVAADPVGFLRRIVSTRTELADWSIEGGPWSSGPFDWPVRWCWAPGVVLVGDAAGYYDPFTGQGIYRALRSAELAAPSVIEALRSRSPVWKSLEDYSVAWHRETRTSVWIQRAVEAVMTRPTVRRTVLRRLVASGGLAEVIRVTGDIAPPATLLNPRVWLGGLLH
jgi:flavin-dependent dehydrogenase